MTDSFPLLAACRHPDLRIGDELFIMLQGSQCFPLEAISRAHLDKENGSGSGAVVVVQNPFGP